MKTLQLRIHRVNCIDETGDWFEWGSDEMHLGANTIDETGDTETVALFKVGDFDDGDTKDYSPPKVFTSFDVREGTVWPKSYYVNFVLSEVDLGGDTADFLNNLTEMVRDDVTKWLTAFGVGLGSSGGVVGAIIGAAAGYAVGKTIEWLKSVWGDDIFSPVTVSVELPSQNSRWDGSYVSPQYVASFSGHDGRYQIVYDWRLTDPSTSPPVITTH
jgi:hypothetical protein